MTRAASNKFVTVGFTADWYQDKPATIARILIFADVISMTRAFALTNLIELLLVGLFILNGSLRKNFVASLSDPRVLLVMCFWGWVGLACSWGQAPWDERLADWWSWRKLILVPICFSLFGLAHQKKQFAYTIIFVSALYMVFSWLGFYEVLTLDRDPAHLLENHSTQGVMFAGSSFLCILIMRITKSSWVKWLLCLMMIGFWLNIIVVVTGRSGYLFLIVGLTALAGLLVQKARVFNAALVLVVSTLVVFMSPNVQENVNKALSEASMTINNQERATSMQATSLGIRVVMWANTLELIKDKPIFGSGAGSFKHDYAGLDNVRSGNGWSAAVTDDPHQQYLHIAAEYGILGLALFILAVGAWIYSVLSLSPDELRLNVFAIAAAVILIGTFANGFSNGHFSAFVEGRFVWITTSVFMAGSLFKPINWRFFRSNS